MRLPILLFFLSISSICLSQGVDTIHVGFNKPVLLVFDGKAQGNYVSEAVELEYIGNQVFIKVIDVQLFVETNIFIKENDNYHVFILKYQDNPKKLLYNYQAKFLKSKQLQAKREELGAEFIDYQKTEQLMADSLRRDSISKLHAKSCKKISTKPQEIADRAIAKHKMLFLISNMYVKDGFFYFRLGLQNESDVDYKLNFIKFEIRTASKRVTAASEQTLEIKPVHIYEKADVIEARTFNTPIYVFNEFTLDKNRILHLEVWETQGDRILEFNLTSSDILKIKELI